jgi:predicted PurR-regulated permease PerM
MLHICTFTTVMILRFILFALVIYIIYKVVFELIIPIFRTTQKIRRQFGDIQQHMQDQMNNTQNGYSNQTQPPSEPKKTTTRAGDYIDFEEVK